MDGGLDGWMERAKDLRLFQDTWFTMEKSEGLPSLFSPNVFQHVYVEKGR